MFNRLFGFMVELGLGLEHNYLLMVRGRKTAKLYSTPVNLVEFDGRQFLVCGRGQSQWVRNAEAAGRVMLKRRMHQREFLVRSLPDEQKPEVLKRYLDSYKITVRRYFPAPAGAPASAFEPLASRYPVFELTPASDSGRQG
ncbi:MAG: nitroreductase family deazaflavin-dependent oxidoreductase [Candidatus Binataceae bacterium]